MQARTASILVAGTVALAIFGGAAGQAASPVARGGRAFDDQFDAFDLTRWLRTEGGSGGPHMGCTFRAQNLAVRNGNLVMSITDQPSGRERYSCAEYRTHKHYGYGRLFVNLKAARRDGVMTTVSSYTGRPFADPWDEVTVGIAGKDTTKLEIGYVVNSVGYRDTVIDLGFDAAQGFHTYGFERRPDGITWFVDGQAVHSVSAAAGSIPQTPGRIYLQLWNGVGSGAWLKEFRYPGSPVSAEVNWLRFEDSPSVAALD